MRNTLQDRKLYVADYETTVSEDAKNQTETEVWSAAFCPVLEHPEPEDATVYNNIFEFVNRLEQLEDESIVFFHNSKFDLSFLLHELNNEGFVQAFDPTQRDHYAPDWLQRTMPYTFKVCISDMNMWYGVRITFDDRTIEVRDSAKILPMPLSKIGKSFDTKYRKLDIRYEGERHAFWAITDDEMDYIVNDVLVLSEAIWKAWYEHGITHPTIGSEAKYRYEQMVGERIEKLFPPLHEHKLPNGETIYEYCQKGYSGGWCWKNPVASDNLFYDQEQHFDELDNMALLDKVIHTKICVFDVNSLYPSVMEDSSYIEGYPVGKPVYKKGEPSLGEVKSYAIFRRFRCRFRKKEGMLPFIHIRGVNGYNANECLTSSVNVIGEDELREYTMTQPEFEMFEKHYDILDYEPVSYLTFTRLRGIFDEYVRYFADMKKQATIEKNEGMRTIAKLFLNSLYGKLATNTNNSYKTLYFEDGVMKFKTHEEHTKIPWYIACGAYVTAYARRFTINAAQQNYYEGELKGIMYADTDSMHIIGLAPHEVQGVTIHDSDFRCWAAEASACAVAIYAKQKTYIEVVTEESFKKIEPKLIIKAAGLGEKGKDILKKYLKSSDEMYINDFRFGLELEEANLKAVQVKGGIVLKPDVWKIR